MAYRSTAETYDDDYEIVMARALASDLLARFDDKRERTQRISELLNSTRYEGTSLDDWLALAVDLLARLDDKRKRTQRENDLLNQTWDLPTYAHA